MDLIITDRETKEDIFSWEAESSTTKELTGEKKQQDERAKIDKPKKSKTINENQEKLKPKGKNQQIKISRIKISRKNK